MLALRFLIAALMLGGAQASNQLQDWGLPKAYGTEYALGDFGDLMTADFTITDEMQDLRPGTDQQTWKPLIVPMATLDEGWLFMRGFSFKVRSELDVIENVRFLAFHGEDAQYLGYLAWYANGIRTESGNGSTVCNAELNDVNSLDGDWDIEAYEEELQIYYWKDDEMVSSATVNIQECAPWLLDAKVVGFGGFSDTSKYDEGNAMDDSVMYMYEYTPTEGPDDDTDDDTDDDNEAENETADMCQRGQFYWMEKCHDCPPGHSTVRQGNTDFNDCIESRYISCQMHTEEGDMEHEVMECERVLCPCNEPYEECDWNNHSQDYGKCKQSSQYASSARGVTGATSLVVMVTTFFSL